MVQYRCHDYSYEELLAGVEGSQFEGVQRNEST